MADALIERCLQHAEWGKGNEAMDAVSFALKAEGRAWAGVEATRASVAV